MVRFLRPTKAGSQSLSCTSGDRADRRAVGEALQIGGLPKRKAAGDRRRFPWNGSGEFIVVDVAMMQTWKNKQKAKCLSYNLYLYICHKHLHLLFVEYNIL